MSGCVIHLSDESVWRCPWTAEAVVHELAPDPQGLPLVRLDITVETMFGAVPPGRIQELRVDRSVLWVNPAHVVAVRPVEDL